MVKIIQYGLKRGKSLLRFIGITPNVKALMSVADLKQMKNILIKETNVMMILSVRHDYFRGQLALLVTHTGMTSLFFN